MTMNERQPKAHPDGAWSKHLQCRWLAWTVITPTFLRLDIPQHNSCDGRGCVKIARTLNSEVTKIAVFASGKLDMMYLLDPHKPKKSSWISKDYGGIN